ncbi:MAG: PD-(D/E)XK nuclease family protein [Pirellulales bacterium]
MIDGLTAIDGRATRGEFGVFDGMFRNSSARNTILRIFGPEHLWSTSQLETYAACPFRFFAGRVLKLEPLPELSFATDSMGRGTWFHNAMSGLHRTHGMDAELLARCVKSRPSSWSWSLPCSTHRIRTPTNPNRWPPRSARSIASFWNAGSASF